MSLLDLDGTDPLKVTYFFECKSFKMLFLAKSFSRPLDSTLPDGSAAPFMRGATLLMYSNLSYYYKVITIDSVKLQNWQYFTWGGQYFTCNIAEKMVY